MRVERGDAVGLTRALVRIDSRNPSLVPGAPGESEVAHALAEVLRDWAFDVELMEVAPGRSNVVARVGRGGGRSLLFNGHLDVVGTEGMVHAPWSAEERNGRIYGRGSADMKSGVAAMCAAAARTSDVDAGEIVIAAVVDEEFESAGTRTLIERGVRADAAIVTEPTSLAIMPAHLGFVWIDVTTRGRAAHGSRWDIGVDAIKIAGLLLAELGRFDGGELARRSHPLLGRPSLHASLIEGGSGMSTYPEQCTVRFERRTIPGESPEQVKREIEDACERVGRVTPNFDATVRVTFSQPPSDVSTDAPIARALGHALIACGEMPRFEGMTAWTDAALLNDAGIPAICFGPGTIGVAHAAEEWVAVDEIERATTVLARLARDWLAGREDAWRS